MASLPSVSRNKTQQIPVDALMEEEDEITASSDWDSDASFEIELISGGTTIGDERSHRIKWRGCHDTFKNWWQTIPEDHSVTGEEYIGLKTTVFKLEQAPKVSAGDRCKGRFCNVVLGDMKDSHIRECFTADGASRTIDLLGCRFDDAPHDWLLDTELSHRMLTDAILAEGWHTDSVLIKAKESWCRGKYLPTFDDVIGILRYANATIQGHPWLSLHAKQAMVEIGAFLCEPTESKRMLVRGHADTLRPYFLTDGLIYDCLTVCVSIEAKDVAQIRILVTNQTRQDGAAAAWDHAFVHGQI